MLLFSYLFCCVGWQSAVIKRRKSWWCCLQYLC